MITLNNNNEDPTHANQVLAYSFFNKAGLVTPRCGFAHVVVNGEDLGVYSHVESIRKPFIKLHFGEADGDLYEGLSGDFVKPDFDKIIHKWGKDDDRVELKKLYDAVQSSGPLWLSELEELLDLNNFITFWVAEVLIGNEDGYPGNRNNWYLYRDGRSGRFQFIPWGADTSFRDGPLYSSTENGPKSVWTVGELCRRLWELPEIRARYQAEMERLLKSVWDEKAMLVDLNRILRLTEDYRVPGSEQRVTLIRDFVDRRREEVQGELDSRIPEFPERQTAASAGPSKPMTISGNFSTTMCGPMKLGLPESFGETTNAVTAVESNEAYLEFRLDSVTHSPFTRFAATAGMATGMRAGYPTVQIRATRENEEKPWTLTFLMDPHQVHAGPNKLVSDLFTTLTILVQGTPGSPDYQLNFFVGGILNLDEFSINPGARISGSFKLSLKAFQ